MARTRSVALQISIAIALLVSPITASVEATYLRKSANPYLSSSNFTPSLGINLEGLSYYSTALPFLNLMKAAGPWIPQTISEFDTKDIIELDANGWVKSIPETGRYDRVGVTLLLDNLAAPPNAEYILSFKGNGTIEGAFGTEIFTQKALPGRLTVRAAADGSVRLQLTATEKKNYIHDIKIVKKDYFRLHEAGLLFNPELLSKIYNFHTLRFMEWMDTNKVFDRHGVPIVYNSSTAGADISNAPLLDWIHRPKLADAVWLHGVPVEAIVQLANIVGADPWVNMPINASDDYIKNFSEYVYQNLDPRLNVHVELSNEVWNFAFPQFEYAKSQAIKTLGPESNWLEWYGMRTAQMGKIWKHAFGELEEQNKSKRRALIVYNTQFDYKGIELYGLQTPHWVEDNQHIRAADYFDEYAITGYYGDFLSKDSEVAKVKSWWTMPDGGYQIAIKSLKDSINTHNEPLYRYHAKQASNFGLKLITYESGFGAQTPQSEINNDVYSSFLGNLQRDERIYEVEHENYLAFERAGGSLYCNFDVIASHSKFGSWGALEAVTQKSSPRYQALMDWNASSGFSAASGRDPIAFQNARVYTALDEGEIIEGTLHGYDILVGGAGDDTFIPYGSNSILDGDAGFNVVLVDGPAEQYAIVHQPDGSAVISGNGKNFKVRSIQQLKGADGSVRSTDILEVVNKLDKIALAKDTEILEPRSGKYISDIDGHIFSFGRKLNSLDYAIHRDGRPDGVAAGSLLRIFDGGLWAKSSSGWYSRRKDGWTYEPRLPDGLDSKTHTDAHNTADKSTDALSAAGEEYKPPVPEVISVEFISGQNGASINGLDVNGRAYLKLNFSMPVVVAGGVPTLLLKDGSVATYQAGSGSASLTFSHGSKTEWQKEDLIAGISLHSAIITSVPLSLVPSSNLTLTDSNGHVFSFGENVSHGGSDVLVLRDGVVYQSGAAFYMVLIGGVIWVESSSGWYRDSGRVWTHELGPPKFGIGMNADLTGAVNIGNSNLGLR